MKTCSCGRSYSAEEWQQLRLVGTQDDGEGGTLELMSCVCRSTMAISLAAKRPSDRPQEGP